MTNTPGTHSLNNSNYKRNCDCRGISDYKSTDKECNGNACVMNCLGRLSRINCIVATKACMLNVKRILDMDNSRSYWTLDVRRKWGWFIVGC
jgi:hypothetical protein